MRKALPIIIVIVALLILVVFGAVFLANRGGKLSSSTFQTQQSAKTSMDAGSSIFSTQSATIDGKITKVNQNSISVTNTAGISGEYDLGQNLSVNKVGASQKMTNSNKKEDIETGKDVTIFLNQENGKYLVNTITYTQPQVKREIPVPEIGFKPGVKSTPTPQ